MKTTPIAACLGQAPPVQFKPYQASTCSAFAAHASSWPHIPSLGWGLLVFMFAWVIFGGFIDWLCGQYEVTGCGSWYRRRIGRRWYGKHAHVSAAYDASTEDPGLYEVLAWDGEHTAVPWLLVCSLYDDRAEPWWAAATTFAPYAVRKIRPHLLRSARLPEPWLFRYLPLRQPSGHPGGGSR